jgi:hypothetical protein
MFTKSTIVVVSAYGFVLGALSLGGVVGLAIVKAVKFIFNLT